MALSTGLPAPPMRDTSEGGGGGWVELARGLLASEARSLENRLSAAGVEFRIAHQVHSVAIFVRQAQWSDGAFVLATLSFERPSATEAPFAERGTKHPKVAAKKLAAAVLGLVTVAAVSLASSQVDVHRPECPGPAERVMAPRGGCLIQGDGAPDNH